MRVTKATLAALAADLLAAQSVIREVHDETTVWDAAPLQVASLLRRIHRQTGEYLEGLE